jgi:ABC-type transport system involved in multi-copper enzyme maturation permease subunit
MIGAEFRKLWRKPSTLGWSLFLSAGASAIFFVARQLNSAPAGGANGFIHAMDLLGLFVGPLAAVMIGAEAGAGDEESGVFRELVVTGRSRLALFAARIPGALMLCMAVIAVGFGVAVALTFVFAGDLPNPSASLIAQSAAWIALADGLVCVVAVGLASLVGMRPAITALIGWQLIVSPILVRTGSLGSLRHVLLDAALLQAKPGPAGGAPLIPMSILTVVIVCLGWVTAASALGAWRANTRDA